MKDKLLGGLYGLLIGDACGVPYEFKRPSDLPPFENIDMVPPVDFKKGWMKTWSNIPTGTWSDDGSQALCLLETLLEEPDCYESLMVTFSKKLIAWKNEGYLAVDNNRFDIGIQTDLALREIEAGLRTDLLAPASKEHDDKSNGNGSLMRALPVALMSVKQDPLAVVYTAELQSHVTHPHKRSKLTCALYSLVARNLLLGEGKIDALNNAIYWMNDHTVDKEEWNVVLAGEKHEAQGTGYVVDSFWSAIQAFFTRGSYEDVVKHAISFGRDTDTTACIAGGLAGVFYGYDHIPQRWIDQLRGKEMVKPLEEKLLKYYD